MSTTSTADCWGALHRKSNTVVTFTDTRQSFALFQTVARLDERLPGALYHAPSDANADETITFAVAGTNR